MTLSYIVSGFAVGLLVGMTGVGGGSLMTPLLTLLFGVPPSVAVGTDLAFASITKSAGTLTHRLRGTIRWDIVKRLCIGALPAAVVSTLALKSFGTLSPEIGQIIRYSIAGSVLLTVVALIFKGRMLAWINAHPEKQLQGNKLAAATIISGAVLGVLVTVSSIGAGAIGATLLVMLYPRMSSAEVAGTDIAYAVPLTAIAALGHWWLGSIHWELLASLLVGSLPGITLGSWVARSVPEKFLRVLLAMTLTGVAVKLIY
ncbi:MULTISPECIES: sulfite exporter TauE/SafE family protein [unclassified Janthinobacterium]|uniref:sulfite exporter TauE/SafE family protein n=1 Tax=unclassified Janthinobacterium TaxID=2610881 RepID=UPI0025B55A1F|nr:MULTISPECIES: sulfite exporter TauE/SafE family protein [unclassified Janthinobacterium]MDN2673386.1 sulfite exporter TauE/SafE family protein [Janthinobacterium sp. SUN026]MDN2705374.1 sulfite exporter TauE/SafE family protein [Janthinobacterium sp. SUN100]MDO8042128.1 sulfite exporter TauE/SafE family protein [Janthinobacterium sp. SUN137]MDO8049746.1 sulfite exporter TauE/SafE family protein [Janthinobacterium sp. SUN211]MDO8069420.1 sulfite exporter TauE/SafE family protein [Janthinobac